MTEQEFKSHKGQFNYHGVLVTPIIGGWNVFETNPIKAKSKKEVDTIIKNGMEAISKSIKTSNQ